MLQLHIALLSERIKAEETLSSGISRFWRCGRIVWQAALILLVCLLLLLAFVPIRRNYYPSFDSSIFSYIGQQILKGRLPYVDAWDHKPPLIFYLDAFGLWLANGHLIGIWLLELVALFSGGLVFFRVLRKFFSESVALSVVLLGILHQARLFDFGNYTEEFSLWFQLLALGLAFSSRFRSRPGLEALLSGLLCGLAFTCKQNTIGAWIAIILMNFLAALITTNRSEALRAFFRKGAFFFTGFFLINFIWAGYFAIEGILKEYWDTAFVYNFIYTQKSGESRWATGLTTLAFLPSLSLFLMLAFLSWPLALIKQGGQLLREVPAGRVAWFERNRLLVWALLALPIELVLAGLSGMNYQHYFILCLPAACVLAAWLAAMAADWLNRRGLRTVFANGLVLAVFWLGSLTLIPVYQDNYAPRLPSANTKTADFLLANTDVSDAVQLWGGSLAPYVMAERASPSRYFNVRPLYLFAGYMQPEQWTRFRQDLESDLPKMVVYMKDSFLAQVPAEAEGFCTAEHLFEYQKPVYEFLCRNYRYRETINEGMNDAWDVFERVGEGS